MSKEELFEAAVGEAKADYYVPRFMAYEEAGKAGIGWNWPAFLVTFPWLLWRRMWGTAGLYFLAPLVFSILIGIIGAFAGEASGAILIGGLYIVFMLAMWIVPGMFGNAWYYAHCKSQIKEVSRREKVPVEQIAALEKKGGTSWVGLGVYLGLVVVGAALIGVLAAIALPAYHDYTLRAKVAMVHASVNPVLVEQATSYVQNQRWVAIEGEPVTANMNGTTGKAIAVVWVDEDTGEVTVGLNLPDSRLEGASILYTPYTGDDGAIVWGCSSDSLPEKLLPSQCRDLE